MKYQTISGQPQKVHVVVLDPGEDVRGALLEFANKMDLRSAYFTGIGAFRDVVLGFFDRERKVYDEIAVREQVEVLALTGNFAERDGRPALHAHAVVGKRDGSALGGHLLRAHVYPTLEVVATEVAADLRRTLDPDTGLALITRMEPT